MADFSTPVSLVTGGAGFVGSHIVRSLVDSGHHVVIIDNLSTGRLSNLERAISSGRVTFVYGDVAVPVDSLRRLLRHAEVPRQLDYIYHLASPASPEAYGADPWGTLAVNGAGTMALAEFALEQVARFLFCSTSEIYGDPLVHPQPEGYFGNVDPIGPRSCYDEGKRFGEAVVAAAVAERGLSGRIVRLFNCYGAFMERNDGRLIPSLIDALLEGKPLPIQGTGKQTRSMTYIDDAVQLIRVVMESEQDTLQPVNVGNDEERSVEDIARTMAAVAGVPFSAQYMSARPADPQRRKPDLSVARSYGWRPSTSLEQGLAKTYAWFRDVRAAYA